MKYIKRDIYREWDITWQMYLLTKWQLNHNQTNCGFCNASTIYNIVNKKIVVPLINEDQIEVLMEIIQMKISLT